MFLHKQIAKACDSKSETISDGATQILQEIKEIGLGLFVPSGERHFSRSEDREGQSRTRLYGLAEDLVDILIGIHDITCEAQALAGSCIIILRRELLIAVDNFVALVGFVHQALLLLLVVVIISHIVFSCARSLDQQFPADFFLDIINFRGHFNLQVFPEFERDVDGYPKVERFLHLRFRVLFLKFICRRIGLFLGFFLYFVLCIGEVAEQRIATVVHLAVSQCQRC